MDVAIDQSLMVGFLLSLVRASTFIAIAPPFSSRAIPVQVKIALSAALAVFTAPLLETADAASLDLLPFANAVLSQALTGAVLGSIAFVLMSAINVAGQLIDTFGGFTVTPAYDPFMNVQSSTIGRVYALLATTLMFAIGGHLMLVRGFLTSFEAVPLTGLSSEVLADLFTRHLSTMFLAGVEIAAPILGALFLSEVVLGLLARAAPMMNVFALAFPFKIGLTLLTLGVTMPLIVDHVYGLIDMALRDGMALLRATAP